MECVRMAVRATGVRAHVARAVSHDRRPEGTWATVVRACGARPDGALECAAPQSARVYVGARRGGKATTARIALGLTRARSRAQVPRASRP